MKEGTKHLVLSRLEREKGSFVSGAMLAKALHISRNSVWKAVRSLCEDGYEIESTTGRGYRLKSTSSVLSAESIERYLSVPNVHVQYHASIDSTNTRAKALAQEKAPEGTLIVAGEQTSGRGRQGRAFFSPAGTGVYFSFIVRPKFELGDVVAITSYTACCLAATFDDLLGCESRIKWVNDIFVDGRKVSGILTEATFDAESMSLTSVVVGIGVNVMQPKGGFADDSKEIAGALTDLTEDRDDLRARIVAGTLNRFMERYESLPRKPHLAEYRKRSLLVGRRVYVEEHNSSFEATVLGINDDFTLEVSLEDGKTRSLASGEVHIPSSQLQVC